MESKLVEIVEKMENYLEIVGYDCSYNKKSISKFNKVSMRYLKKVKRCEEAEEFIKKTVKYIKNLNDLNSKCDYELIETDQRESIVSMIFDVASQNNINVDIEEDFTLEYREW